MIRISAQRDPFSAPEHRSVEWGIGCTARALAPEWWSEENQVARNGGACELDELLADGDQVFYWTRPGAQVGIALAAAFFVQNLDNPWLTGPLAGFFAPKKKPVSPSDATSPTYSFTGLRANARGDGLALPVLYGEHRVTPPIVNEYIRSSIDANGNPLSQYQALMIVSEGPILSIGGKTADGGPFTVAAGNFLTGLQINGQPAENFEGVEAHVRLGNLDQDPIAEFVDPVITVESGVRMNDPETLTVATSPTDVPGAGTAIATTGFFAAGNANITKWNTEASLVSLIGSDLADEFTALLEFPSGLVGFDGSGNVASNSLIYQIRYVQVDDGGTPFGNYIVLPARQVTLTRRGRLVIEDRQRTYDPSSYAAPSSGLFLESQATANGNLGASVLIDTTKFTPPAPAAVKFSLTTWCKRRNTQVNSTTSQLFQWTGTNTGFRMRVIRDAGGNHTLSFQFGNGSSFTNIGVAGTAINVLGNDLTNWHNVAVTYEASAVGTSTRIRIYIDGVQRLSTTSSAQAVWDVAQQIRVGSDSETAPTLGYDGHFDETLFWNKTLTQYEVTSLYNGNNPIGVDTTNPNVVIGAEFDTNVGSSPNIGSPSFGFAAFTSAPSSTWRSGNGTNTTTPNPKISSSAGIVKVPLTPNTPKRSKWRVDVLRLDLEEANISFTSEVNFQAIQWRTFQKFNYPGLAQLAISVPATDQISGSAPTISVVAEGKLIPVWDGVDATYPNMPVAYSRSPAWVAADIATATDYGLGDIYRPTDLDIAQFDALADFSDERIYDNMPRLAFLTAAYLDSAAEAVTFDGFVLGIDVIRYKVASLPAHFPDVATLPTGQYIKPILAGLSPAPPSWFTATAALVAQEVIYVEWRQADSSFYIYTRTTQTLGAGQTVYTVTSGSATSNGLENHDVRCRFDGYFDRTDTDAWETLVDVLQTARASPVRIGARLSVFVDDVATPTMLVGMGNIIAGSWRSSFQDVRDRPNAMSAEFFDEDKNFERDSVIDEHPELVDPSNESAFRWRRVRVEGVTRRSQVKRGLRRDLNHYFLTRRMVEFELGIDALPALPGDLVAVSHDVPGYGISGRLYADSTSTTVILDRDVTITSDPMQIQVESAASEVRATRAIGATPGFYAAGASIGLSTALPFAPDADDKYAIGEVIPGETKLFRLVESTLNPKLMRRRMRLLEYNEDVYSDDFGELPAVSPSNLPAPSAPIVPPGVENLQVSEATVRGPDGAVSITALVSFTHDPETYHAVGGTDVYVSVGTHYDGFAQSQHVAALGPSDVSLVVHYPFARHTTYTIWVLPRTRDGATAYRAWTSFFEFSPTGLAVTPLPPRTPRVVVSGENAVHQWEDDGDLDMGATVESRLGGWILGRRVFAAPAQARSSGPITNWADGPTNVLGISSPTLYARTKLRTGQYSAAVEYSGGGGVRSQGGTALATSEEDTDWS